MGKVIKTALLRDLESQLMREEISYSKMVEVLNEKAETYAKDWQSVAEKLAMNLESILNELRFKQELVSGTIFYESNSVLAEYKNFVESNK